MSQELALQSRHGKLAYHPERTELSVGITQDEKRTRDASVWNPGHLLVAGRGAGSLHLALFGVEPVAEPVAEEVH